MYTIGKWEQSGSIILVYGEKGGIICQMAEYRPQSGMVDFRPIEINDPHWDTQMSNANLIKAAPNMHTTLKHICDRLYGIADDEKLVSSRLYGLFKALYTEGYDVLRMADEGKALAKAEGK